ncbi:MAG: hypothetical protein FJ299_03120 [Planctomycetes bacterium]|nr:hypothetical protein [Planctomycetota bacterium]
MSIDSSDSAPAAALQAWVEFFGRLHPLLLHAPIGLLVAIALLRAWQFARRRRADASDAAATSVIGLERAIGMLCWATAFAALLTAGAGLVLAREDAYVTSTTLDRHRLLGIAIAVGVLIVALTHGRPRLQVVHHAVLIASLAATAFGGHLGAELSHGAGFLTEPFRERVRMADPPTALEVSTDGPARVYEERIAPILAGYCIDCHGPTKRKGSLALHGPAEIELGGISGDVLSRANPAASELLRRVHVPIDDDECMPPAGKPRPNAAELDELRRWIEAGAPLPATELEPIAPQVELPVQRASVVEPPADAVAKLRAKLLHVQRRTPDSPLLWIDAAAIAPTLRDDQALEWLGPLAPHIADLSLARSGVGDALAPLLARMERLERLDLSATRIGPVTLRALGGLPELRELVLTRTALVTCTVEDFAGMPALANLRVWNSGLQRSVIEALQAARPNLRIDDGTDLRSQPLETEEALALTSDAPLSTAGAEAPAAVPINTICPVSGAPIKPGFTREHEGRLIGFCCNQCPLAFDADPGSFAAKLP